MQDKGRKEVKVEKESKEKLVKTYIKDCYEEYCQLAMEEKETEEAIRLAVFSLAMPSSTFFSGTA